MKQIEKDSKYRFYLKKKGTPEVQKGIYILLHERKKIPVEDIIKYLDEYDMKYGTKGGTVQNWSKKEMLKTLHMDKFLEIVTTHTGIQFQKRAKKQKKQHEDYDSWYARASMDGSLAYNNSSDDL